MIDLGFETGVFLFTEVKLKVHNLFFFAEISNYRAHFGKFYVGAIIRIGFTARRRCCFSCLPNACCLRADRFEVMVEYVVLLCQIVAPGKVLEDITPINN